MSVLCVFSSSGPLDHYNLNSRAVKGLIYTFISARSFPRSFELDVVERSDSSKIVTPWRTYKKYVKRILIAVSICIVFVFILVSSFSYTRFSTFYHIAKKRTFIKLHHIFGI